MRREVYIHEQVEVPFWFGRDILRDDPERLVSGADRGEAPRLGVGCHARLGPFHLVRPVKISFGAFTEPAHRDGLCYRDISWEADRGRGFFPLMEGKLELSALTSHRVQLSFIGCYRPPFSVFGAAVDAAALHRVAEASLETLLRDAARALERAWTEEPRRTMAGWAGPR